MLRQAVTWDLFSAHLVIISIILGVLLLHHLSLTSLLLQSLTDELSHLALLPWTLPANHKPANTNKMPMRKEEIKCSLAKATKDYGYWFSNGDKEQNRFYINEVSIKMWKVKLQSFSKIEKGIKVVFSISLKWNMSSSFVPESSFNKRFCSHLTDGLYLL